ncbi:MAG: hypothetical protein ACLP9L_33905 [Thermoguttaceae bacterium]
MGVIEPQPAALKPSIPCFRPTPGRCLATLLVVEGLFWLSERFGWLSWQKGYALLTAVALVAAALAGMILWFPVALIFRSRFQFSIRSLLVVAVAVAIPCSWLVAEIRRATMQRQAVARIVAMGGSVQYNYDYDYAQEHKFDDNGDFSPPEPPGSPRLRELRGDDLFNGLASCVVASIDLQRYAVGEKGPFVKADVSDDDMHCLLTFPMLRCLSIEFQPITDAGIKHLGALKDLQDVDLYGTQTSDECVQTLVEVPSLERVNVGRTRINATSLACLLGKTKLKTLELSLDQIDRAGGWEKVKALFPGVQIANVEYTQGAGVSLEIR